MKQGAKQCPMKFAPTVASLRWIDKQREIASKGGQSVPDEKRSFSQDPDLAREAGRDGGQNSDEDDREFAQDGERSAEADGQREEEAAGSECVAEAT
jgi:general stress protein YciG